MYIRQLLFKTVLLRNHEHQILQISLDYRSVLPKPISYWNDTLKKKTRTCFVQTSSAP